MPILKRNGFVALRAANFLANYHHYLVAFVLSTIIASFVGETWLGLVVAGASAVMAISLGFAPSLFTRFGTNRALAVLGTLEIVTLVGLALSDTTLEVVLFFTLQGIFTYSMFVGLDLLLEAETRDEKKTGNTRGVFLTITNIAVFAATLSLAWISVGNEYLRIFLASAGALIPFVVLAVFKLPKISNARHSIQVPLFKNLRALARHPSLAAIMGSHFLLQLFFSWMVIYAPLFLFTYIGFSWSTIGLMLTIAMLPYVLFEYPLGYIADKYIGEKELLVAGFIMVGVTTIAMSFLNGAGVIAWGVLLVLTRIGAATIEVMTETHFFRHVDEKDTDIISIFRVLRPTASVVGPIIGTIALLMMPLSSTFIVFGVILLFGIPLAVTIKDSK